MAREIRDEKERLLQEIRDKEITVAGIEDIDLNTDGLETLQTATNTKLDTLETTLTAIETDQAALEVLQTSTNTKLDTLETTANAMQVDLAALETLQTSTNTKLDTLETTLTAIETDMAALEVLQTSVKTSSLSAIAPSDAILIDDTVAHTGPYFAITCIGTVAAVVDVSECDMSFIDDVADFTIPIGVTIYGTFTSIELDSGVVIAYTL